MGKGGVPPSCDLSFTEKHRSKKKEIRWTSSRIVVENERRGGTNAGSQVCAARPDISAPKGKKTTIILKMTFFIFQWWEGGQAKSKQ